MSRGWNSPARPPFNPVPSHTGHGLIPSKRRTVTGKYRYSIGWLREFSAAHSSAAAKERGWREMAVIDAAYAEGRIDRAAWHEAVLELIEPVYLATDDPRAQSGYNGTRRNGKRLAICWCGRCRPGVTGRLASWTSAAPTGT